MARPKTGKTRVKKSVSLNSQTIKFLTDLGNSNLSAGIEKVAEYYQVRSRLIANAPKKADEDILG